MNTNQIKLLTATIEGFLLSTPKDDKGEIIPITDFSDNAEMESALYRLHIALDYMKDYLKEYNSHDFKASLKASTEASEWVSGNMDLLKNQLFELFPGAFADDKYRELAEEWLEHVVHCLQVGSMSCKLDVPAPTGLYLLALHQLGNNLPKDGLSERAYDYVRLMLNKGFNS